jgi:penicillin-binding protein 2
MYDAIAVSSDVYFYTVIGGYKDQKGLGVTKMEQYMKMFGFEEEPTEEFFSGKVGTVPDPEWKKKNFDGDDWRIGDTYTSAIGQYGWLVTPIQAVRATASIANGGKIIKPTLFKGSTESPVVRTIDIPQEYFEVAKKGMYQAVHDPIKSSAKVLNSPDVNVCAKTGTAELGVKKDRVNSWVVGFFPCDKPKYAFAILMENGDVKNLVGGTSVMRQVLDWMAINTPEHLK